MEMVLSTQYVTGEIIFKNWAFGVKSLKYKFDYKMPTKQKWQLYTYTCRYNSTVKKKLAKLMGRAKTSQDRLRNTRNMYLTLFLFVLKSNFPWYIPFHMIKFATADAAGWEDFMECI